MGFVRIEIITSDVKMSKLLEALKKYRVTGVTVYKAMGCGVQYGSLEYEETDTSNIKLLEKNVVMVIMPEETVEDFVNYVEKNLYTGHIGDGKIIISSVSNICRIRTGEEGYEALVAGNL